jgi:ubiquinone/menaquinone biosynthesis C-methylase UbiE
VTQPQNDTVVAHTRSDKLMLLLSRNAALAKFLTNLQANTYRLYPLASRRLKNDDVFFLNFGYEEDPPMDVPLAPSDEPNRFPIQLYHRTATQVDLTGKQVLEVSCGHGGGASYLTRTQQPASYTGLDINPAGIEFCRKRHDVPGLYFVQGNAESLPFAAESFDAVINIEAGIHYGDFAGFLAEVARVLRPGGHFLYADLRDAEAVPAWEATLANAPLRQVSTRIINDEVVRGIQENPIWDQVPRLAPNIPFVRRIASDVTRKAGSWISRRFESGESSYRLFCFVKD